MRLLRDVRVIFGLVLAASAVVRLCGGFLW